MVHRMLLGVTLITGLVAGSVAAQSPAPADARPNDYSAAKAWLCRPDLPAGPSNACDVDLATTVVAADGKTTRETFKPNPAAPIDCFYVYPTVSTDPTDNSDMNPDPAELNVVRQQFARFASVCKVYAPIYRQVTLAGLRKMMARPGGPVLDWGIGYTDVRDAWRHYLEHDNNGRGYVFVSHSQGSYILTELIRNEIDGKPIQSKMVSALLLGSTLPVAKGKDAGGAFKTIPLCHSATQTGCVINYSTFRSTVPPPANTLFGRAPDPSLEAACVNPAALGGGSGSLHAYLDAAGNTIVPGTPQIKPWATGATVETPWVSVPGLLTARCTSNEHANFLEVTVNGDPADPRVDDITGDIGSAAQPLANWGLHLIDVNLAMGNLLDIVGQQAKAYNKK